LQPLKTGKHLSFLVIRMFQIEEVSTREREHS
jgi:hypothetical protein